MLELGESPRILITRLSAIGDCVHTLPLVVALRRRYPQAYIAWATQGGPATLLAGQADLDAIIRVDRNWMKSWKSIQSMRQELREMRFDVAIDPQSLTKSSALGWLSGAQNRIGFAKGQARELSPWLNNCLVLPRCTHVVDRYLELLGPLQIETSDVEFSVPRGHDAIRSIDAYLKTKPFPQFALINPGAGWNSKLWPAERYAEIASHLSIAFGLNSIVLWAGEQEKSMACEIVNHSPATLAPDTTLPELAELCRRAKLFVGSDTGPMHLAAAVGTRCVAMYGPTSPEVCGPYGDGHQSLQAYLQQGTGKQRRGDDNSAMQAITVEMVKQACDGTLRLKAA